MSRFVAILLLVLVLAFLALIGASFFMPGATDGMAQPHPEIAQMLQSKGQAAEHPIIIFLGSAMGFLIVALMGVAIWAGLLRKGKETPLGRRMIIVSVVYGGIFAGLFWAYAGFLDRPLAAGFFGAFPVPTAWMIYGVWIFSLVFVVLYTVMFDRWVLTQEELSEFKELLDRSQQEG